jgi:hypothetical protein
MHVCKEGVKNVSIFSQALDKNNSPGWDILEQARFTGTRFLIGRI